MIPKQNSKFKTVVTRVTPQDGYEFRKRVPKPKPTNPHIDHIEFGVHSEHDFAENEDEIERLFRLRTYLRLPFAPPSYENRRADFTEFPAGLSPELPESLLVCFPKNQFDFVPRSSQ
jgi:hypothetical protein